jgi:hypothetical protein
MKTTVALDDETAAEVDRVVGLINEKPATVVRMALQAGLPVVASSHQSPRPDGYFADDYPLPEDRIELEKAMAGSQKPDR